MKKLLIVLFVAGALSACSAIKDNSEVSFASHHHQSSVYKTGKTALPIPASAQDWEKYSVAKTSKLIDVPLQEKKVYYFTPKFKLAKRPAKGGFYREILGKTSDGNLVIQDFYQDSGTKQIDPAVVSVKNEKNSDSSAVEDGILTFYSEDGKVSSFKQTDVARNEVVYGNYVDGTLVMTIETDLKEENVLTTFFYPNGKKMIQVHGSVFGGEEEYFDDDGKLLFSQLTNEFSKEIMESEEKYNKLIEKLSELSLKKVEILEKLGVLP
jgi:hypothetical protein